MKPWEPWQAKQFALPSRVCGIEVGTPGPAAVGAGVEADVALGEATGVSTGLWHRMQVSPFLPAWSVGMLAAWQRRHSVRPCRLWGIAGTVTSLGL